MNDCQGKLPPTQQAITEPCFHPSGTFVEFPLEDVETSIPARFAKIVRRYPDRLAIKMDDRGLTYRELNKAANRVAHGIIRKRGPHSGAVALLLGHGVDLIAAILGTLKAGKFYVAIDPLFPAARIEWTLENCQTDLIITDESNFHLAQQFMGAHRALLHCAEADTSADDPSVSIGSGDPVCISYTSGSTGEPKGVIKSHRHCLEDTRVAARRMELIIEDRLALLHSPVFGAAKEMLNISLLNGAALFPFDLKTAGYNALAQWLVNEAITTLHITPQVFRQLAAELTDTAARHKLRVIRLSGEPITQRDFELYKKTFSRPTRLLLNMGSTETGALGAASVDQDFAFPETGSPIGYRYERKPLTLVDEHGREVDPGTTGEIVVKSKYLATGYWGNQELADASFSSDPADGTERIYRTGDLARQLPDGFLVHMGRKDSRTKIRGYRIDFSEVENVLLKHPAVKDAGVAVRDRRPGKEYLAAYIVAHQRSTGTASQLRAFLRSQLPEYMVPSDYVFLDSLPLTNGKLDRRALPEPDSGRSKLDVSYVAAGDELQRQLVALWEEVLEIRPIGVDDNFFDLGGHSLMGARIIGEVHRQYGLELPLLALFEAPTIAQLAAGIKDGWQKKGRPENKDWRYLFELQAGRGQRPLFVFPGGGGSEPEFFIYAGLARHVGTEYPVYGLRARGTDSSAQAHASVEQMAADYLEDIRAIQPEGPYYLIGECAGGVTAYEAARQLRERGQEIALLALLDVERPTLAKYWLHRVREFFRVSLIKYHGQQLRQLEWNRWPAYLRGKGTGEAPTQFGELLRARAQAVLETDHTGEAARHVERARTQYRRVVRRYRPRTYSGPITILASEKLYHQDATLGWSRLEQNGLHTHLVPGDHDSYLREYAHVTAQELRKCLEQAENRAAESKSSDNA